MEGFLIDTPDKFQQLYGKYYKAMMLYALRMVTDRDVAEDLVQNVFLRLWERRDTFMEESAVRSFLYLNLRHHVVDYVRHAKVEDKYKAFVKGEYVMELPIGEEEERFANEIYVRLFEAINELPSRQRELFLLYMQGKKNAEIAQVMHITEETIRVQKKRAIKTLRKKMGDRDEMLLLFFLFV